MSTTPRRAWGGLATLLLPVFLVSMDASVLYLAMPHLTARAEPQLRAATVDPGHLSVHARRVAHHHGQPGRSLGSPAA